MQATGASASVLGVLERLADTRFRPFRARVARSGVESPGPKRGLFCSCCRRWALRLFQLIFQLPRNGEQARRLLPPVQPVRLSHLTARGLTVNARANAARR
jgi:hypothetical protein